MFRTQKELSLLKDMKNEEKLCADKYSKYSNEACDPQLKSLFSSLAQENESNYTAVCQMEKGEIPSVCCNSSQLEKTFTLSSTDKTNDKYLCSDALSNEKHVSHLFDTCIFEFCDEPSRKVLNSIQCCEQNHGKVIYDYMKANNMYA